MYDHLKKAVCLANVELERKKLAICSWGNVSGIDRTAGIVAIKPSGVPYKDLTPDKMTVVDLAGKIIEGALKPSSDTPTHLELYRNFKEIGGVCHTHSCYATMWAQACRELPCYGTTHADYFYGAVPVTEPLSDDEIKDEYELNTGKVIVRRFVGIRAAFNAGGAGGRAWAVHMGQNTDGECRIRDSAGRSRQDGRGDDCHKSAASRYQTNAA